MKNLLVSEMKEGQVYKMDLLSFYDSPAVKRAGYTATVTQLDPEKRFPTDEFTLRKVGLQLQLQFLGDVMSRLTVRPADMFKVRAMQKTVGPDFRHTFFGIQRNPKIATTGWDPEIFVVDKDGEMIPAFDFLPSKENPFIIQENRPINDDPYEASVKTAAYWDGFQAEFTTVPYHCHGWGFDQLQRGLRAVYDRAKVKFPTSRLTLKNVFEIPEAKLLGYSHEQVNLGCDPSKNAYGTDPFQVENPYDLPYRMAGGHIHFGIGETSEDVANKHARFLDFLLTIPTIGMFADIDDPIRRQFYGRAGEHRLPPHGMEYRTLSNAWLGHPAVGNVLMDIARWAIGPVESKFKISDAGVSEETVRDIINNTDVKAARKLYTDNAIIWESMLNGYYRSEKGTAAFTTMVTRGVEEIVPTYRDLEKNWHLRGGWNTHSNSINGGDWQNYVAQFVL